MFIGLSLELNRFRLQRLLHCFLESYPFPHLADQMIVADAKHHGDLGQALVLLPPYRHVTAGISSSIFHGLSDILCPVVGMLQDRKRKVQLFRHGA